MATRMSLWRLNDDGSAVPVPEATLATEEQIESAVESAPELLGIDVLIIGRQTQTPSGPLDLLALDSDAQLVVIENKRNRTPREVLAQTIDYAAWVSTLTFDKVEAIYAKYRAASGHEDADLAADFEEQFGEQLDTLGDIPRMIVVAAHLDDATERMIDFLSESFDVPVNAVLFQPFEGTLLGRTWLRPDAIGSRASGKRSSANVEAREQARQFWDTWLPVGREVLTDIKLPARGPKAVWIKRSITPGIPAALQMLVTASSAYSEVQFDDDDPLFNDSLLRALKQQRSEIESAYGAELDWRGLADSALLTKRTKVVAPQVGIGSRTEPHDDSLRALAESARRLVDAVKPHLQEAFEAASVPSNAQVGSD